MYLKIFFILYMFVLVFYGLHCKSAFAQTGNGLFSDAQSLPDSPPVDIWAGPPVDGMAGQKAKPIIVRKRHVHIDTKQIVGKGNERGADSLDLNLFDGVRVSAKKDRIEKRTDADYSWFGTVDGYKNSYVIMVVGEDTVAGNIVFDNRMYQVRYTGSGVHNIQTVDVTAFADEACKTYSSLTTTEIQCSSLVENGSVIDVLVAYTPTARDNAGGTTAMLQQIQLGINETNLSVAGHEKMYQFRSRKVYHL